MSTKDYPEDFPDKLDYALHTLSPTQRIAFESWTPKHEREDAKADAAVLSEVFGTSLTPQEPSAELKARVMEQVAHTEQIQPANELGTDDVNAEHKSDHANSEGYFVSDNADNAQAIADSEDSAYARAKRRWFGAQGKFSPSRMTAVASIIIAAGLGIWGFAQHQQLEHTSQELQAARVSSSTPAHPATARPGDQSIVEQISMAPDLSMAQGKVNGMPVSVMYSPSHNMAGGSTTKLPALPEGKVYKLWFYDAQGNIVGSGILNSAGRGAGITTMTEHDLSTVTNFGISIEDESANSPSQKPAMLENVV